MWRTITLQRFCRGCRNLRSIETSSKSGDGGQLHQHRLGRSLQEGRRSTWRRSLHAGGCLYHSGRQGWKTAQLERGAWSMPRGSLPESWKRGLRICDRGRASGQSSLGIAAGTLEERGTDLRISAIAAPQADGPADRCPNPGGEGYGSAIAGEPGIDGGPGSLPEHRQRLETWRASCPNHRRWNLWRWRTASTTLWGEGAGRRRIRRSTGAAGGWLCRIPQGWNRRRRWEMEGSHWERGELRHQAAYLHGDLAGRRGA